MATPPQTMYLGNAPKGYKLIAQALLGREHLDLFLQGSSVLERVQKVTNFNAIANVKVIALEGEKPNEDLRGKTLTFSAANRSKQGDQQWETILPLNEVTDTVLSDAIKRTGQGLTHCYILVDFDAPLTGPLPANVTIWAYKA